MYSVYVPRFFTVGVSPFGYLRVEAYLQLTAAFRSLSRPSSAPDAKAFTLCSCSLELFAKFPLLFSRSLELLEFLKQINVSVIVNSFVKRFYPFAWIFLPPFGEIVIYPNFLERPSWIWLISVKSFLSLSSYLFVSYSSIYFIRFSMNIFPISWIGLVGSNSNHSPTYRVLICSALKRFGLIPRPFGRLVGSSGLEPPTSRLSGARSNHLSYEPIQFSVYLFSSLAFGGDDGNRTHDPLLAGQVLSQLSYTPKLMR